MATWNNPEKVKNDRQPKPLTCDPYINIVYLIINTVFKYIHCLPADNFKKYKKNILRIIMPSCKLKI